MKGWTLGPEIEARNATHQIKKMTKAQLLTLRDRLYLEEEIPDEALDADQPPYYRPPDGSPAHEYLSARRKVLAGPLPSRVVRPRPAAAPPATVFADLTAGSGTQAVSTTMAFARLLRNLVRDPAIGRLVAPIVPDEARTFGLEPLIAETKIYAPEGQRYTPVDSDLILRYAEDRKGQVLEEGITEAGSMASFIALSTAYATWGQPMLPIYLFYSMFGFQRTGDLMWLLGDIRGRGILAGCTAGRTTLQGEGLQHDDGHSPLLASVNPAARVYDPAFAYEIAVIMEEAVAPHPRPRARGPVLVPHPLQRELRHAPPAPRPEPVTDPGGDPPRHLPVRRAGRRRRAGGGGGTGSATGHPSLLRSHVAGGHGSTGRPGPRLGRLRRRLLGDLLHRAPRRRPLGRARQPPPPHRRRPGRPS